MYEKYTRMSLPDREYRLLLASAIYIYLILIMHKWLNF